MLRRRNWSPRRQVALRKVLVWCLPRRVDGRLRNKHCDGLELWQERSEVKEDDDADPCLGNAWKEDLPHLKLEGARRNVGGLCWAKACQCLTHMGWCGSTSLKT